MTIIPPGPMDRALTAHREARRRRFLRCLGFALCGACLLWTSPARAPLIDDPSTKPAKLPCKYQMPPSKVDCPKEHDEFWRRMTRSLGKKRDRIQELEDRVQELESQIAKRAK